MNHCPRFTLRVKRSILNKVAYLADYHGRTKNKEIEMMIKKYLNEFERLNGTIPEGDVEEEN